MAGVEMLDVRPLQCFRYLERDHVQQQCGSGTDRSNRCYQCEAPGYKTRNCKAQPHCAICADLGRPAGHRLGSTKCIPPRRKLVVRGTESKEEPTTASESSDTQSQGTAGTKSQQRTKKTAEEAGSTVEYPTEKSLLRSPKNLGVER